LVSKDTVRGECGEDSCVESLHNQGGAVYEREKELHRSKRVEKTILKKVGSGRAKKNVGKKQDEQGSQFPQPDQTNKKALKKIPTGVRKGGGTKNLHRKKKKIGSNPLAKHKGGKKKEEII